MAFGKRESYNDDLISYIESVDRILNQDIFRNKETTSTTYIGTKTDTFTFYQCDDCGCAEVLSNSYYCPNCGKKII